MDKVVFKDIEAEHPNRYRIVPVAGQENTYDVAPARGKVTVPGNPVRAKELNDLQDAVEKALNEAVKAAADEADTASKKAAAAAASATSAASAAAQANRLPLEAAGDGETSVQSKNFNNQISGNIKGSLNIGNGGRMEGNGHDWQFATGWQNQSRGNNTLNAGSRNIVAGHNSANIGQDNEARDYNGHNIGFQNVAAARQTANVGTGLLTDTPEQIAVGVNNAPNAGALLMVGNGTTDRQNFLTLQKDGTVTLGGHFVSGRLYSHMRGYSHFDSYTTGTRVSLNSGDNNTIIVAEDAVGSGKHLLMTSNTNAGGVRPQMLVTTADGTPVAVEAGHNYTVTFKVAATGAATVNWRYWLCVTPVGDRTAFTSSAQKDATVVIEPWKQSSGTATGTYTTITATITDCLYSGWLRLGICGATVDETQLLLDDIRVREDDGAPVYAFASVNGYTATLYKIAECQTAQAQKNWMAGKTVTYIDGTTHTITATEVENALTDRNGDGYNYFYGHEDNGAFVVDMVCVDRIVPGVIDAPERGIYVSDNVASVSCNEWVDEPFENDFSLIESITLAEDTSTIARTLDTNGHAYAFKDIIVTVAFPGAVATSKWWLVKVGFASDVTSLTSSISSVSHQQWFRQTGTTNAAGGYAVAFTDRRNGIMNFSMSQVATNIGYILNENDTRRPVVTLLVGNTNINSVEVRHEVSFPAGTVIKIYGVK